MRLIRHNVIENYLSFNDDERTDLLLQELSKAVLVYPLAMAQVLESCGIDYQKPTPKAVKQAICENASDLKMLNRVAKVLLVTTDELSKRGVNNDRETPYRELMRDKSQFFKDNSEILKDVVLKLRETLNSVNGEFDEHLNMYLNMDGEKLPETQNQTKLDWGTAILMVAVLAGGYFLLTKKSQQ
jgi:hypothetical protein